MGFPAAAFVLILALLSQSGLAAFHGLSHWRETAGAASACHVVGHDAAGHHDADVPAASRAAHHGDSHRHQPSRAPGREPAGCDLCALIAVGKLGWAAPLAMAIPDPAPIEVGHPSTPEVRSWPPSLTSAAPRGPPHA